jgi:hypothetical protein
VEGAGALALVELSPEAAGLDSVEVFSEEAGLPSDDAASDAGEELFEA